METKRTRGIRAGSAYISPDVRVNGEQYRSVGTKRLSGHRQQLFPKDPNSISTFNATRITFMGQRTRVTKCMTHLTLRRRRARVLARFIFHSRRIRGRDDACLQELFTPRVTFDVENICYIATDGKAARNPS